MHGVIKNIAYLCARERSRAWGKDGWKEIVGLYRMVDRRLILACWER